MIEEVSVAYVFGCVMKSCFKRLFLRNELGALTPLMLVLFTDIILLATPRSIISGVCNVRGLS